MPIYQFIHPETKEIFEEIRSFKNIDKLFIALDGVKCERIVIPTRLTIINKNAEVFEKDPAFVKKCKPKYVKFKDGHKEKYDPTKHC